MGELQAERVRGREVFSFSYEKEWLENGPALILDPDLGLYSGPQYIRNEKPNFGLFTDSSPDRWGRVLMERREAYTSRIEGRRPHVLMESDYLLGVYDIHRMGAIRYKTDLDGTFLNADLDMAAPPFTFIRTLEETSLHLEETDAVEDPNFASWLNLLVSPGSSLGGARPKASVVDPLGNLWIAKFPSRKDDRDMGAWESVANELAVLAGINVAEGQARRFTQNYHTFLTKRFDRAGEERIHFASAMTLLGYTDGTDAGDGVSYLELAEFIMRNGRDPDNDLEELWKRIVFNICISNSDDHLRNHGFLLTSKGWELSPAYDINPIPNSSGLSLNISQYSNLLDLELAREVGQMFRLNSEKQRQIIEGIKEAASHWQQVASKTGISKGEIERMEGAFILTK